MTNTAYQEYIESPEWKQLRSRVYLRAEGLCELCGDRAAAIHHIRYPKDLKDDDIYNLLAVCECCHRKLHAIKPQIDDEALFYSANGEFRQYETCPTCGNDTNHIVKFAINKGGNITLFKASGKYCLDGEPTGRGVSLWIHFQCEMGHKWHRRWQFHKGYSYIDVLSEPGIHHNIETLWRD